MTGFIIEADHYRNEVVELMNDPIIEAMAVQASSLSAAELSSYGFISAANDHYHALGGTLATSIGGPARAILALRALAQQSEPLL